MVQSELIGSWQSSRAGKRSCGVVQRVGTTRMQPASAYSRFIQALNILNAALERHRNSLSVGPLLSYADLRLAGRDLVAAIVDADGNVLDRVTIRLDKGAFVLVAHGGRADRVDWTASIEHLTEMATHPRRFIDDPQRLDLKWLEEVSGYSPWAAADPRAHDPMSR